MSLPVHNIDPIETRTVDELHDQLQTLAAVEQITRLQVLATQGWLKYRLEEQFHARTHAALGEGIKNFNALEEINADQLRQIRELDTDNRRLREELQAYRELFDEKASSDGSLVKEAVSRASGMVEPASPRPTWDEFIRFYESHPEYSHSMLANHFGIKASRVFDWIHRKYPVHSARRHNVAERRQEIEAMTVTVDPDTRLVEEVAFAS